MKIKKLILSVILCAGILSLGACSTPNTESADDMAMNDANSNGSASSEGIGQDGSINGQGSHRRLSQNTYYFDYDRSEVHSDDRPAILANANNLAAHPTKKVIVEGHTDPRGSREYNVGLGERRSHAVADMLKSNGVNPGQIREVSYGAQRLASTGHTESDFQQDRRAKIVYQN